MSKQFPFWENIGHLLKLAGQLILDKFKQAHGDARKAITAWTDEILAASWKSTHCIRARYGSADFRHDNKVIFDIKGNRYRLVAKVDYQRKIVLVEWIGPHSEYVKMKF